MKTKFRAGDVVVDMPLFHSGLGGSIPTSALQFHVERIHRDVFMPLNEEWHSRLPGCANAFEGIFYGALYDHHYWAVAWWSKPVARKLNGRGWFELRRFAIHDDAPPNTASRMLGIMRRDISRCMPDVQRLISYQDTSVHDGTIYKAAGWQRTVTSNGYSKHGWASRDAGRVNQSTADKVRWEYPMKPNVRANRPARGPQE